MARFWLAFKFVLNTFIQRSYTPLPPRWHSEPAILLENLAVKHVLTSISPLLDEFKFERFGKKVISQTGFV